MNVLPDDIRHILRTVLVQFQYCHSFFRDSIPGYIEVGDIDMMITQYLSKKSNHTGDIFILYDQDIMHSTKPYWRTVDFNNLGGASTN
ncbi:MAG: hypothetical protein PHD83_03435 [Caldisericia bacterium]|nr:hypothetical protein [Caldisericia bacterium]